MGVFEDPPNVEGGERRPLSDDTDVIIKDLEEEGLLLIVENRSGELHCAKFDFGQCDNLKVDIPARGVEKTDRFKCQIEVPPKETMNLCHLKVVDISKGGYDMRYRVAVSKRNKEGEMEPCSEVSARPGAELKPLPPATGPAAGADRKKLNDHVTLLIKDMDDAYLMFLESEGATCKYDVTIDFAESANMHMDAGPDVEATGPLTAKLIVMPQSRTPLARLRIGDGKEDALLKYKVAIKPL